MSLREDGPTSMETNRAGDLPSEPQSQSDPAPGRNTQMSEPGPRLIDAFAQTVGRRAWIPRRIRSFLVRSIVGQERQEPGFHFDVDLYGHRYNGHTNSHIDWYVYYFGGYDILGSSLLRSLARRLSPTVVLDVGANSGTHTIAVQEYSEQIHCFEPYEPVRNSLAKNIHSNGLTNVVIHPFGLSDRNAQLPFHPGRSGNQGTGSFADDTDQAIRLPVRIGDEVIQEGGFGEVDLIKIDVEGHECQVLRGLESTLNQTRPIVMWELHAVSSTTECLQRLPPNYETLEIRPRSRWSRTTARLIRSDGGTRANLLSVPSERLSCIGEFVS